MRVGGMTCASCVAHVEKALKRAPGVLDARVNLAAERADLTLSPRADLADLAARVKEEGYEPRLAHFEIGVGGMTCGSCVAHVERALKNLRGVLDVRVNLASERAFRRRLGLEAAPAPGGPYSGDEVARHAGLSPAQLGALALFDVLAPVEGRYAYADLVAARAVGRLLAGGARFPAIVAAALALERRGERLGSVRLAEAPWGAILQVVDGALAEADGKVLSHKDLLVSVWGPAHAEDMQYLRVFIGQLRQKIEIDPSTPRLILTQPGFGYRFMTDEAARIAGS